MHDADARRDDLEAVVRLHAPLEELVAGTVALELDAHVELEGVRHPREVDLNAVIDHQVDRHFRLDQLRIFPGALHRAAHGGEVHHQRHAGEVLEEHARDNERDFLHALGARLPRGEVLHVFLADALAVQVSQERLEHDAQADGHARHSGKLLAGSGERGEAGGFAGTAEYLRVRARHGVLLRSAP